MTKRQLKDHFLKMIMEGNLREVLNDERFKNMSKDYIEYSNAFIDVLKNRKHTTIVFMAVHYILK